MKEARQIDDVYILPINYFAPKEDTSTGAKVRHLFQGSWSRNMVKKFYDGQVIK